MQPGALVEFHLRRVLKAYNDWAMADGYANWQEATALSKAVSEAEKHLK